MCFVESGYGVNNTDSSKQYELIISRHVKRIEVEMSTLIEGSMNCAVLNGWTYDKLCLLRYRYLSIRNPVYVDTAMCHRGLCSS